MALSTQELGTLAELRFQTRCVERGIECFSPVIGGNPAIDFVIRRDGQFISIQVKKALLTDREGKIKPRVIANSCDKRYKRYRERNDHACDFFAFVCLELNSIWLVPASEVKTVCWGWAVTKLPEIQDYLF